MTAGGRWQEESEGVQTGPKATDHEFHRRRLEGESVIIGKADRTFRLLKVQFVVDQTCIERANKSRIHPNLSC